MVFLSCKEKKAANDWGKLDLHGKVKTLIERDYILDTTGNNKGKHLRWTEITIFNIKGQITERIKLDEKGDTQIKSMTLYDNKDRVSHQTTFITDELTLTTKYIYDTLHFTSVARSYKDSVAEEYIALYKYNTKWVITEVKKTIPPLEHNSKNTDLILDSRTYLYDKGNRLAQVTFTDTSKWRQVTTYSYDKEGNCVGEQKDTVLPHQAIKIKRIFDQQNNKVEETSYESDGSIHSQKKMDYKTFDKTGNWLIQYIHWKDLGTTIVERSIVYYP